MVVKCYSSLLSQQSKYDLFQSACKTGNLKRIQSMRENINCDLLRSGVYTACKHGRADVLELLLDMLESVNMQSILSEEYPYFKTRFLSLHPLLMIACENGHTSVIEVLLRRGVDVNQCNRNGQTALMFACKESHDSIINILLKHGADVNIKDRYGKTALMWIIDDWNKPTLNAKCCNRPGSTFPMEAIQAKNISVIKALVGHGADVNVQDICGDTALTLASKKGNLALIKAFVNNGADTSIRDRCGNTVLEWAVLCKDVDVIQALVDHGANTCINSQDEDGKTALMLASMSFRTNELDTLIHLGADVNIQDKDGRTALMHACQEYHRNTQLMINKLIQNGADVDMQDKDGFTALALASYSDGDNCVSAIKNLVHHGANVNMRGIDGTTALMLASQTGHVSVIQTLLDLGADATIQNNTGETALMFAQELGHVEAAAFLSAHEISPQLSKEKGLSAEDIVAPKNVPSKIAEEKIKFSCGHRKSKLKENVLTTPRGGESQATCCDTKQSNDDSNLARQENGHVQKKGLSDELNSGTRQRVLKAKKKNPKAVKSKLKSSHRVEKLSKKKSTCTDPSQTSDKASQKSNKDPQTTTEKNSVNEFGQGYSGGLVFPSKKHFSRIKFQNSRIRKRSVMENDPSKKTRLGPEKVSKMENTMAEPGQGVAYAPQQINNSRTGCRIYTAQTLDKGLSVEQGPSTNQNCIRIRQADSQTIRRINQGARNSSGEPLLIHVENLNIIDPKYVVVNGNMNFNHGCENPDSSSSESESNNESDTGSQAQKTYDMEIEIDKA